MYIECKSFDEWLDYAGMMERSGISPGGMAKDFGVSRQSVNNWINDNIMDAYFYEGQEGRYVIIDTVQYEQVRRYRDR